MDSSDDSNKGFFKHVFNFDDDSKSEILNTLQYLLLAIIPVIILTKTIGKYVPEADSNKGSAELVAEILIQEIISFSGLFIIHRIITYVPTYSNTKYPDYHIIFNVLGITFITMSLQTKLGEKINILVERVSELWNGKSEDPKAKKNKKNSGNVKVSQPISGQQQMGPITGQPGYTEGTAISALPNYEQESSSTQQLPNYNNMFRQDTTPLVGAATPGGGQEGFGNDIMPANAVLGGGFGSAW